MNRIFFIISLIPCMFSALGQGASDLDWWDELHDYPRAAGTDRSRYISISPGYMGPNALRVPALTSGIVSNELWLDNRVEFHSGNGDRTLNLRLEINIPVAKDRAVLYVHSIPVEGYEVTPLTRDERRMMDFSGKGRNTGDIGFGMIFQLASEERSRWPNITFRAHSKTTTGGNLDDARFTDHSMFFWESTVSKTLMRSGSGSFLIKGMLGFYTWQTNRNGLPNGSAEFQNDAGLYGIGAEWTRGNGLFSTDISGYHGYIGNRDYPAFWRNRLSYRLGKGMLSLRTDIGLKAWDWNTYSLSYTLHFMKTE